LMHILFAAFQDERPNFHVNPRRLTVPRVCRPSE